jgi:hypothetical protein
LGVGAWGSELRAEGSGLRVWGLGFRFQGLGCRVLGVPNVELDGRGEGEGHLIGFYGAIWSRNTLNSSPNKTLGAGDGGVEREAGLVAGEGVRDSVRGCARQCERVCGLVAGPDRRGLDEGDAVSCERGLRLRAWG